MGVSAATFAVSFALAMLPADADDEGGAMSFEPRVESDPSGVAPGPSGVAPGPSGALTTVLGEGVSGAALVEELPGGTDARPGTAAACGLAVCAPAVKQVPNVIATATVDAARLCQGMGI